METPTKEDAVERKYGPWQDWINLALGIWLFISPLFGWTTQSDTVAAFNAYLVGLGVASFAVIRLGRSDSTRWAEGFNIAFGLWLIVSPALLMYTDSPAAGWNHAIVGVLIVGLSFWSRGWRRRPTVAG